MIKRMKKNIMISLLLLFFLGVQIGYSQTKNTIYCLQCDVEMLSSFFEDYYLNTIDTITYTYNKSSGKYTIAYYPKGKSTVFSIYCTKKSKYRTRTDDPNYIERVVQYGGSDNPPLIVDLDTFKLDYTYQLNIVDWYYYDSNGGQTVNRTIAHVQLTLEELNEINFSPTLCEGDNIYFSGPLNQLSSTEDLTAHTYKTSSVVVHPELFISPKPEYNSEDYNWQPISLSDFTFDNYQTFLKNTFACEDMFLKHFVLKLKYYNVETLPPSHLPVYHRPYQVDENEFYVVEDDNGGSKLHLALNEGDTLDIYNFFRNEKNINVSISDLEDGFVRNKNSNGEIIDGFYNISESNRLTFGNKSQGGPTCTSMRYVYIPEIQYNYINNTETHTFWYPTEERNAVTLKFKYPKDDDLDHDLNYSFTSDCDFVFDKKEIENGLIYVPNSTINGKKVPKPCHVDSILFATKKDFKKIDLTITSKNGTQQFAPVHITLKDLKVYPIIESEGGPSLTQPECHDSPAKFTFPKFKGGLGLENEDNNYVYYYTISGNNKEGGAIIESGPIKNDDKFIELNTEITDFTVKITDSSGNNDTENNNTVNEDTGIDERSFSFDDKVFYVTRPGPLSISISSTNPLCNGDSNGVITVTPTSLSYPNAEDNYYKWSVYNDSSEDPLYLSDIKGPKAEGLPAGSYQVEFKNHLCSISYSSITLEDPPLLKITDPTASHVICNGYSTGKIESSVDGGTPFEKPSVPYHYHWAQQKPIVDPWNSEPSTSSLYNLPAGYYKLTVTDAHDCQDSTGWIEISQPDALDNSLTPSYTICKGGELAIDDGKENPRLFTKYEWIQPDGTIKQGRPIVVDSTMPQGQYILKSINEDNCFTLDTTLITFAENDLPVKFLVPSESFLADTLVIAEDSEIDADFNWYYEYNSEMFKDITEQLADRNKNQTYLWVERSGCDTITMFAENGFCKVSLSKAVTIINDFRPEGYDYTIAAAGIFSRLQIGPNPNNGEFTLFANLTEESELDVSLYDVSRSRRIPLDFSKYKTPSDRYQIPFQGLGLRTGIYTLLVSANGETKQIKFVVE